MFRPKLIIYLCYQSILENVFKERVRFKMKIYLITKGILLIVLNRSIFFPLFYIHLNFSVMVDNTGTESDNEGPRSNNADAWKWYCRSQNWYFWAGPNFDQTLMEGFWDNIIINNNNNNNKTKTSISGNRSQLLLTQFWQNGNDYWA